MINQGQERGKRNVGNMKVVVNILENRLDVPDPAMTGASLLRRPIDDLAVNALVGKISQETFQKELHKLQSNCLHNASFTHIISKDAVICDICEKEYFSMRALTPIMIVEKGDERHGRFKGANPPSSRSDLE